MEASVHRISMTVSAGYRLRVITAVILMVVVFDSYASQYADVWIVKKKGEQLRQVQATRSISRNIYCRARNTLNLESLTMISKRPFSNPVLSNPSQRESPAAPLENAQETQPLLNNAVLYNRTLMIRNS